MDRGRREGGEGGGEGGKEVREGGKERRREERMNKEGEGRWSVLS